MKTKLLMIVAISFTCVGTAFAQKGELNNAQDEFASYTPLRNVKVAALATQANAHLSTAKVSIDKASANPKTATMTQTYALKGAIYAEYAVKDTVPSTSTPLFATAEDNLKKAKELDTKGEFKKMIDDGYQQLIQYKYTAGVKAYQTAKYDNAYEDFNFYRTVKPDDTTALYLTGLSAAAAKKYEEAISSYTTLTTKNYSKNATIYADLSLIYLQKKDTVKALKVIEEGTAKFPQDNKLSMREVQLNLQAGNQAKVIEKVEKAIVNDPKNKTLYYYAGLTYGQAKDMGKAEAMYRKAIELDPNYFDAYLNLGFVLLNPGINLFNAANKLPASKQKEYDDDMAKAAQYFEVAKPIVLKAVELKPNSIDALTNLRTYYSGTKNSAEVSNTAKKIEAERAAGGN